MTPHRNEIRCFCTRRPLMAVYGVENGEPFIHIKIYKQNRLFGEIFVDGDATCRIRCRECLRLHKIKIITTRRRLELEREVMDSTLPNVDTHAVAPIDD